MIGIRTVGVRVFQISHDKFEHTHTQGFHRLPENVKDIFFVHQKFFMRTETIDFVVLETCKEVEFRKIAESSVFSYQKTDCR